MSDLMKTRLLYMIDTELEQVRGSISNNKIWLTGCVSPAEEVMFEQNIADYEEFKEVLLNMRKKVLNDELYI
jgi:hypothetical protein